MNGRGRVTRTLLIGASVALLIVGWYLFAPSQLGGHAAYVTTTGTSMEPKLHEGDVVIVRSFSEYHVGDVVAYHNPDIGQVVLHRIVALDGDRFVMKGDNNTWLDSYRPAEGEILGGMAALVPGMGGPLGAVRTPWGMSAVVSMAALGVFGGRRKARRAGEAHASAEREEAPGPRARAERGPTSPRKPTRLGGNLLAALAGVAALAAVFGLILFALSPTTVQQRDVIYQHDGTFSYEGEVGHAGLPVYGRSRIQTGDPVYLELTQEIRVDFDYAFETAGTLDASGTARMVAEISDINGWRRSIELAPPASFDGGTTTLTGTLDLAALGDLTSRSRASHGRRARLLHGDGPPRDRARGHPRRPSPLRALRAGAPILPGPAPAPARARGRGASR